MALKIVMKRGITIKSICFSVLVPVYNVENYLEKCIDSVLSQSYRYFELILVDDGSTDHSSSICDRYAKSDDRIRVFHQPNQGLIMARRNAIARAWGDYFLFLDSDDYWDADLLETINSAIREYCCDMVIFNYKKVMPAKIVNHDSLYNNGTIFEGEDKKLIFEELIKSSRLNNLWIKAVSNRIVDYKDYYKYRRIKYAEDLLQSLPLLYNARRILYLDKAMYNYRINPQSLTHSFNFRCISDITIVRSIVWNYMNALDMTDEKYRRLYYQNYVDGILDYLSNLCNSKIHSQKKKIIMEQVQNIELYIKSKEYIDSSKLSKIQKIRLTLFQKKSYGRLILFEKMLGGTKNALSKILRT